MIAAKKCRAGKYFLQTFKAIKLFSKTVCQISCFYKIIISGNKVAIVSKAYFLEGISSTEVKFIKKVGCKNLINHE